jgi:hypothetical protein
MITNSAISNDSKHGAFRDYKGALIADVWRYGLNPEYWRHGLTINQGLGWSVSEVEATKRLNYIRVHLLKAMFGNNFRRKSAKIIFLRFKQGSREDFNQHYHALRWRLKAIIVGQMSKSRQPSMKLNAIDQKSAGKRECTSIGIGRRGIGFIVTLLVMRRMTETVSG